MLLYFGSGSRPARVMKVAFQSRFSEMSETKTTTGRLIELTQSAQSASTAELTTRMLSSSVPARSGISRPSPALGSLLVAAEEVEDPKSSSDSSRPLTRSTALSRSAQASTA